MRTTSLLLALMAGASALPALAAPRYDAPGAGAATTQEVQIESVHAVFGPAAERCWIADDGAMQGRRAFALVGTGESDAPAGAARVERRRDGTSAGSAVPAVLRSTSAGAEGSPGNDVPRCPGIPGSGRPEYWTVTFRVGDAEYQAQLAAPPGPTLYVDATARAEPFTAVAALAR